MWRKKQTIPKRCKIKVTKDKLLNNIESEDLWFSRYSSKTKDQEFGPGQLNARKFGNFKIWDAFHQQPWPPPLPPQQQKFWTQIEKTSPIDSQYLWYSQYGENKWTKQSGFQHLKHSLYFNLLPKLLKCTILRGGNKLFKVVSV